MRREFISSGAAVVIRRLATVRTGPFHFGPKPAGEPTQGVAPAQLTAWRADPFRWAQERLGVDLKPWADYGPATYRSHRWDGTVEPLWTAAKAIASGESAAVSSAVGIGKTYEGAVLTLWWQDCWEGGQVVTVAPKEDQLALHIWKEIGKLWPSFRALHPAAKHDTLRIRMRPGRDDWGAVGFVCGVGADEMVASRARGFHAEHLLIIFEETTGIDPAILSAFELTCTAPHNLRLFFGNPDSQQDALAMVSREPGIVAIRASALDHPNLVLQNANLVPGAQSVEKVEKLRAKYGDDDPLFQSRVRGIAPAQGQTSLIRLEWLQAAAFRAKDPEQRKALAEGETALGVDVANSVDGDRASIAEGKGKLCIQVSSFQCPDANAFGRRHVWPFIQGKTVRAERVGIDNVGVGVGTVNEIRRLGAEVAGLNGGAAYWENYAKDEKFANLRSQMWWQARVDLHSGAIGVPNDPELFEDLVCPKWRTLNGKIIVESKEDLKARLGRSPDKGDAFVYWNWIRQASNQPTVTAVRVRWG